MDPEDVEVVMTTPDQVVQKWRGAGANPGAAKPHDLVNRNFRPLAPVGLRVADFIYVSTWSGWCYTASSTGAVGSSFDNALAESAIGLYKTELIKPRRPWKGFDDLELATAEWIDWFNHPHSSTATTSHPSRPGKRTTITTRLQHQPEPQARKSPDMPGRFSSLKIEWSTFP